MRPAFSDTQGFSEGRCIQDLCLIILAVVGVERIIVSGLSHVGMAREGPVEGIVLTKIKSSGSKRDFLPFCLEFLPVSKGLIGFGPRR